MDNIKVMFRAMVSWQALAIDLVVGLGAYYAVVSYLGHVVGH